jgi:PAS domain S-box-containing protein
LDADVIRTVAAKSSYDRPHEPDGKDVDDALELPLPDSSAVSLMTADEAFRSAFDASPTGASVAAPDGRWLEINDAYCQMLGYERAELLGRASWTVTHADDSDKDRQFLAAAVAGTLDELEGERRYIRKDGSTVWASIRTHAVRDRNGSTLCFVSHVQDISERRAAQGRLRDKERTLRSVIDHTPAMVCVKDRDHRFELVNREFEQAFGVRSDWIVGRRDSDLLPASVIDEVHAKELLVLDSGQTTQDEETVITDGLERVLVITRFPLLDDDGAIHAVCTTSTDITERRHDERAKRERLECSELIYSAMAQDRFVLHGQPIAALASMSPVGVELLIRMAKVRGGQELVPPGMFLPAAERFDLIQVIDQWVVGRAVDLAAAGHRVTVNVSAKTISDPPHVDLIEQAILASKAPAENLVFEITETAIADNLEAAGTFAMRLRKLGCAIALDDFGIGHGAFTYLRRLPVDYLKIDMQFVRDLLSDDDDRQVVEAIVGVARQFKVATIAEGVEDQATLEELRRMGVDYAQGYWVGRPAPLPEHWQHPRNRRQGDPDPQGTRP